MERYETKIRNEAAVIIGGTSGMGLATAKMLIDGGARVLVTGRSQAGLESGAGTSLARTSSWFRATRVR